MTLKQRVLSAGKRITNRLPFYNRMRVDKLVKAAVEFEKTRRGTVTQQYIETVDKIVDQPYPYSLIKKYSNRHPFLRIVHNAIIREAVRNRWDVKEKFAKKCVACGMEYEEAVTECKDCLDKGVLRDPNPQEKKRLEAFLDMPNRDDEFIDIIKSILKDNLAVDDWYLSIVQVASGQYAIYVEDSAEMFICADKHGRLGNGVWFCGNCWSEANTKVYKSGGPCPFCGSELKETAYVQKKEGTIKARYGREEIIHGASDVWLPQLYGNSKVMAILMQMRSALAMSNFNFATYSKGHLAQIIGLKGEEQSKADEIAESAKEQTQKVEIDAYTGQIRRVQDATLWVGTSEGLDVHQVMPDPDKMQSLDWMEFWFVKIAGGIYGVQPVMINAPTRGPGGYFQRQQIVVQNDTTRELQRSFEDPFNELFVKAVLGIHDWRFQFNEIEPRNELEEAQIWQVKVAAGSQAKQAGLDAEITDEGELKISGSFVPSMLPQGATHYLTGIPQPPKPPEPQQNVPFATDKMRRGQSFLVTELTESKVIDVEPSTSSKRSKSRSASKKVNGKNSKAKKQT